MSENPVFHAKKKKGRAAYQPSDDQRELVARKAAARVEQADIAALLGISVPTLRKHFGAELKARVEPENLFTAQPAAGEAAAAPLPVQPAPRKPRAPRADGRKRWMPDAAQRREAQVLLAANLKIETIAKRFGISPPTARRAFKDLIDGAYEAETAEILINLQRAARKGNVTAMTKLRDMLEKAELDRVSQSIGSSAQPPAGREARPEDPGKKAMAMREAHETAMSPELSGLLGYVEPPARPN